MMNQGLVFSIEEFSVFDGPGIRTSVFLKGCPLRCEWCHNPEGQSFENTILRSPNGCVMCCACVANAIEQNGKWVFSKASIDACPRNLLRYCAEEYTPHRLCQKLEKNLPLLNASGGGVTFSGGEPTANPAFLLECLSLLEGKTNRAVQTCGFCSPEVFEKVLANCDYMLFDIKLINDTLHKKYTGVSNAVILENFRALAKSGKDFVIRVPLIPSVNDTEENIRETAKLLRDNNIRYVELLPYNRMAGAKYKLAGMEYAPSFDETLSVNLRTELFAEYGIEAKKI